MKLEGKVENMNIGEDFFNCNISTADGTKYNIKLTKEQAQKLK